MRRQLIGLTFLLLLSVLPTALAKQDAPEDEKLYGSWSIVSVELDGKALPISPDEMKSALVFSKGGKLVAKKKDAADKMGTWKVSADKTPKEIDLVALNEGVKKQDPTQGLYQVDGDTLKLAFLDPTGLEGKSGRPKAIDSKQALVVTLKRQKP